MSLIKYFYWGVALKTKHSILKQMLSLLLQNQLLLRLRVENLGGKEEGLFLLLKKSSFFFPQEGLCFAFTSGIFRSPELNSKSVGFGTWSCCTHLHKEQAFCSSPRFPLQPWDVRCIPTAWELLPVELLVHSSASQPCQGEQRERSVPGRRAPASHEPGCWRRSQGLGVDLMCLCKGWAQQLSWQCPGPAQPPAAPREEAALWQALSIMSSYWSWDGSMKESEKICLYKLGWSLEIW